MWSAGVQRHEIPIGLIKYHPDSPLAAKLENLAKQRGRIYGPTGVVRRHNRNRTGSGADLGGDVLRPGQHAVGSAAIHIPNPDAKHAKRGFMVEVAGACHQDFVALTGDGQRRGNEGLIASGCYVNLGWLDIGLVNGAEMRRIGDTKIPVALDAPIFCGIMVRRGRFQCLRHVWVRRITGHGLAHIDQ